MPTLATWLLWVPSGRLPDLPEQRRYKFLKRRLVTFRAKHPEGDDRWTLGTIRGHERAMERLAEDIRRQGRKVP